MNDHGAICFSIFFCSLNFVPLQVNILQKTNAGFSRKFVLYSRTCVAPVEGEGDDPLPPAAGVRGGAAGRLHSLKYHFFWFLSSLKKFHFSYLFIIAPWHVPAAAAHRIENGVRPAAAPRELKCSWPNSFVVHTIL